MEVADGRVAVAGILVALRVIIIQQRNMLISLEKQVAKERIRL